MNKIPKATRDYLDMVVNPINCDKPSQVPDLGTEATLVARGQLDLPSISGATGCIGMLCWIRTGWSDLLNDIGGGVAGSGDITSFEYLYVDTSGHLFMPGAVVLGHGITSVDSMQAQSASVRLTAAGLRVLPKIEVVTDTSVPFINFLIGGQLSLLEIYRAFLNSENIVTAIKTSPCAETYGNSTGACVRYDPFQDENQLRFLPGMTYWNNQGIANFDGYRMPCMYIEFSEEIGAAAHMPAIFHATAWHEITIRQPTFLYGIESPVDVNFPVIRSIMSRCINAYPLVVPGHTFLPFNAGIQSFLASARQAISVGTHLWELYNSSQNRNNNNNKRKKKKNNNKRAVRYPRQQTPNIAGRRRITRARPPVKTTR